MKSAVIIGGGLDGLSAAITRAHAGFKVDAVEKCAFRRQIDVRPAW